MELVVCVEECLIFSIHYFFAEGKKVKGMVRNDVFGDGIGRSMNFLSVCPCVTSIRDTVRATTRTWP